MLNDYRSATLLTKPGVCKIIHDILNREPTLGELIPFYDCFPIDMLFEKERYDLIKMAAKSYARVLQTS